MKMEQTECSETSAYKIQTPDNYPEERIQRLCICWSQYKIIKYVPYMYSNGGSTVAQWLWYCATNRKVAGSIPAGVIGIDIKSFRSHYGPGVDSASNRNEYQEYFLGLKAAGA